MDPTGGFPTVGLIDVLPIDLTVKNILTLQLKKLLYISYPKNVETFDECLYLERQH